MDLAEGARSCQSHIGSSTISCSALELDSRRLYVLIAQQAGGVERIDLLRGGVRGGGGGGGGLGTSVAGQALCGGHCL